MQDAGLRGNREVRALRKECAQIDRHAGQGRAINGGRRCDGDDLAVSVNSGLAIHFHTLIFGADDPVFLHTCFGVDVRFDAVDFQRGNGNFDDEFGGGGMLKTVVAFQSENDYQIGFRFRVRNCEGSLLHHDEFWPDLIGEDSAKAIHNESVEWRFWHFGERNSVDQLCAKPFTETVKIRNGKAGRVLADSWDVERYSHAGESGTARLVRVRNFLRLSPLVCVAQLSM